MTTMTSWWLLLQLDHQCCWAHEDNDDSGRNYSDHGDADADAMMTTMLNDNDDDNDDDNAERQW